MLDDEDLVTLKRPHPVRWLSLHQAVRAIHTSWGAIVITLDEESRANAEAAGYLRRVNTYSFIATTCLLMDILPLFTKLSKVFQRSCLDFSMVRVGLKTVRDTLNTFGQNPQALITLAEFHQQVTETGQYQGQPVRATDANLTSFNGIKDSFIGSLLQMLNSRFPDDTMKVLRCFDCILNPKSYPDDLSLITNYGQSELKDMLEYFQPVGDDNEHILNEDRLKRDFLPFKHHTRLHRAMTFPEYLAYVINTLGEEYPDFVILGQIALSIPLNSASCERGFSSQNLTKTRTRNRLSEKSVENLMKISINGPDFAEFDYSDAAQRFRAMKNRSKV